MKNGNTHIERIREEVANETKQGGYEQKTSIFHELLRSDLPDSEKDTSRIKSEAFALLAAGVVPTTGAIKLILYYILANPHIETRLREELKYIMAGFPEKVPSWAELEKLPYLTGCIKEGLRFVQC